MTQCISAELEKEREGGRKEFIQKKGLRFKKDWWAEKLLNLEVYPNTKNSIYYVRLKSQLKQ